jgi:hypothetical protein
MQPTHHLADHDAELDARLREAIDPAAADLEISRERSRYAAAFDLDDAIAAEVSTSRSRSRSLLRSRRPALAIVGGLATALLVAGALAPEFRDGSSSRGGAPFVAGNASAAEVLERAAERLLSTDPTVVGSGPAWHSVAAAPGGNAVESWYDADAGTARWARFQAAQRDLPLGAGTRTADFPATFYVLDVDAAGNGTIRQYQQRADGSWAPQAGGAQMNSSVTSDPASAMLVTSIETEALAWLKAVNGAQQPSDLHAANERFVERTHMWFAPPAQDPTLGEERAAARSMQLLYLLRIARLEPDAVAQLYRDVIDIDDLVRLENGTVDGREVVRLRLFNPPKGPEGEQQIPSVLLLDAVTGEPIGMEATDGTSRELFSAPRRTAAVGAEAISCGHGEQPPCELLRGEGPIVAKANAIAAKVGQPIDATPGPVAAGEDVGNPGREAPGR